jgi:amidase
VPFAQAAATPPGRLRIACSRAFPPGILGSLEDECARALDGAAELLRSLGHDVREQDPDYGLGAIPGAVARYLRGTLQDQRGLAHPERLERRTRNMARLGALIPQGVFERVLTAERALTDRIGRLFDEYDVLITPATATGPPRIGQLQGRGALYTLNAVAPMVPYNGIWNATGQPAAAVPAGIGSDGVPRGVQIVGRTGGEGTLLALAAQIEAARPWTLQRPPGFA